jgi:hypothetical protein
MTTAPTPVVAPTQVVVPSGGPTVETKQNLDKAEKTALTEFGLKERDYTFTNGKLIISSVPE